MKEELVKLVDATNDHIELIYKWRNQDFIRKVMYQSNKLEWDNHVEWIHSVFQDDKRFLKVLYYDDVPYGIANFHITDNQASVGQWGFYIAEKNAPKGMGKILAYKMLCYLFDEIKVRKICAEVLAFNEISLNFHEKIGFTQEGVLRQHILKENQHHDVYLYSILKHEWLKAKTYLEIELFE